MVRSLGLLAVHRMETNAQDAKRDSSDRSMRIDDVTYAGTSNRAAVGRKRFKMFSK